MIPFFTTGQGTLPPAGPTGGGNGSAKWHNGGWLWRQNGAATADACCCDCPYCPSIDSLPKLCSITIQTPIGAYTLIVESPGEWVQEIIDGVCYYTYDVDLFQTVCLTQCQEEGTAEISPNPLESECVWAYDPVEDLEPDCEEDPLPDGTLTTVMEGVIAFATRTVVSDGVGRVQCRMNCDTGVKQMKVSISYLYTQHYRGRFSGDETLIYEVAAPCEYYSESGTGLNPLPDDHTCDEDPQFIEVGGEEYDAGHDWIHRTWMNAANEDGGLAYDSWIAVVYEDTDWRSVTDFFDPESVTPKACNDPAPVTSILQCSQTAETVGAGTWPLTTWEFNLPATWDYWSANPGDCLNPFIADCPFPPPFLDITTYSALCTDNFVSHDLTYDTTDPCP